MSDTGTFSAAISHLTNRLNSRGEGSEREELRQAIRVLEDWPKWEPLIEAAGNTDAMCCLKFLERIKEDGEMRDEKGLLIFPLAQIRNLLRKALPDKEEEPKIYRCESCGREFDHNIFSHGRAEDDGHGNPIEVECGPISEVK